MTMVLIAPPPDLAERPQQGPYTVEDFYRLVPDGVKADLIDGYIYVASPDTLENDDLGGFLYTLLRQFGEETSSGRVFGSRYAYRLSPTRCPEPDVSFVAESRLTILERGGGTGAPDLAVEIVSNDSRRRDYQEKFRLYQEAGVREYWIIDPQKRKALFYLMQDEQFVEAEVADGVYHSAMVPGFWLRTEWLFQAPLPKTKRCLELILG